MPRSGLRARIDPDRIRQVVDNLIDNSLRYCPRGSVIELRARAMGQDLWLEVADDGPGFDPTFLPHAFDRFRRSDTSRSRDHGGAGLGLAIVSSIVDAHGGTVIAENRTGRRSLSPGHAPRRRLPGPDNGRHTVTPELRSHG